MSKLVTICGSSTDPDCAVSSQEPALPPRRIEVVEPVMAQILRGKTEAERLAIAWGMWRSARDMLSNLTRAEHPEWRDEEVQQEVARRMAHGTQ